MPSNRGRVLTPLHLAFWAIKAELQKTRFEHFFSAPYSRHFVKHISRWLRLGEASLRLMRRRSGIWLINTLRICAKGLLFSTIWNILCIALLRVVQMMSRVGADKWDTLRESGDDWEREREREKRGHPSKGGLPMKERNNEGGDNRLIRGDTCETSAKLVKSM